MSDPDPRVDRALVCRVRSCLSALPLSHVVETMRPLPIQALAGMPPFVRGLSIIRGAPVPVVDAGALLGLPPDEHPTRFVTLKSGDRLVALAVEEVVGIRELSSVSLQTLPPLLKRAKTRVAVLVGMLDANLLVVLRDARIVPDPVAQFPADEGGRP